MLKKRIIVCLGAYLYMGRGGFEPPKQFAADLQSVPFGHSGLCPFVRLSLTDIDYSISKINAQARKLLDGKQ